MNVVQEVSDFDTVVSENEHLRYLTMYSQLDITFYELQQIKLKRSYMDRGFQDKAEGIL